jgi:transcriptional regulator of arginine metabolism
MLNEHHQERREAILRLLRGADVRGQSQLAQLLKKNGYDVTQSSVSRDLRDLGVLKAGGRYLPPPDEMANANGDFHAVSQFLREIKTAGTTLIVLKTTIGAAVSVTVTIDRAGWPEVVGTIAGDDTIFIAVADAAAQRRVVERLHTTFRI